jgi:TonB family protein
MKLNAIRITALVAAVAAIAIQPAGAATGTALTQDQLTLADQPARVIAQPSPVYSLELRHARIEGKVVVAFVVTPKGEVANATILQSTNRGFDAPTLRAINQWKYAPALKAGVPVKTRVNETVTFSIEDSSR